MAPTLHEFLTANKNFFDLACIFVVGLVFRRKGLLRKKEVDALSRLCFTVCFPALLFASIYETKLNSELWLVPCTSFAFHAAMRADSRRFIWPAPTPAVLPSLA